MKTLIKSFAVRKAYHAGIPFRVRLEYHGWTERGNRSAKWWEISFDGSPYTAVFCNHGKIGSSGLKNPLTYDIDKALDKLHEKLGKGYDYVAGTTNLVPDTLTPANPEPEEKCLDCGSPIMSSGACGYGHASGTMAKPAPHPLASMPAPYCDIRSVRPDGDGAWAAYGDKGEFVMKLSESGASSIRAKLEAA
jgi:hypothetical protein